ncbi:coiled-coil domain-containing protein 38 isoform X2 [Hemicordylus capensis]|uniref:coiled-coil domain-containing protein 38 isoform X2 n=1 Tax=Hemicordylus capensis TaxID=884348 RepID=UPI00230435EB|nr:coiled-coil domain-containing protein 38 isoform X2 [Hemicordylus capensis]
MASKLVSIAYPPCLGSDVSIGGKSKSPFRSLDTEIYLYRDIECIDKEKIRKAQQSLKVYQKSTISSRARSRKALKKLEAAIERETQGDIEQELPALNWALAFAQCCKSDKQSITDYISEQKELFLLEYAVKIKQCTISKMEELAAKEERRVRIAETKLEEDTIAFEEYLKENDRSSVEALKLATQEAKSKMEVTADVKSAMSELFSLKSDIANTEDLLRHYLFYEAFLLSVSPKEWQEQQVGKKKKKEKQKETSQSFLSVHVNEKPKLSATSSLLLRHKLSKWAKGKPPSKKAVTGKSVSVISDRTERRKSQGADYRFFRRQSRIALGQRSSSDKRRKSLPSYPSERSIGSEDEYSLDDINSDEEPYICFKHPQELLQIFTQLEEQNLSLFQTIQDISATLEDNQQRDLLITEERAHEDKLEDLKRMQEERLKAALARAIAAPKKRTGRKLVYRSEPTKTKQGEEDAVDLTTKSEDDYYFT